jgi:hypothetical protein
MQKYKSVFGHEFCVLGLVFVLVSGLCANLWASDKDIPFQYGLNWLKNSPLPMSATGRSLPDGWTARWQAVASGGKEAGTPLLPDFWISQQAQELSQGEAGTGAISGQVTQLSSGDPIENVVVTAEQLTCPFYQVSAYTNSIGFYVIGSLPSGKYVVYTANDSDFVDVWWNDKPHRQTADTVVVASNDTTENINFSLRVGGKIAGTITLTGASYVFAYIYAIDTTYRQYYFDLASNVSGSSATYVIKRLPTGIYKLNTNNFQGYVEIYYDNESDWESADPVSVTEGVTTSSIDFILGLGGSIKGNISSSVRGPLEGIYVFGCYAPDPEWHSFGSSEPDGNYVLTGLRSGYWKIFAWGDTTYAFEFYNNKDTWSSADSVLVTAPDTVLNKDFALEIGGSISGHVYEGGAPVSGCHVTAIVAESLSLWPGTASKSDTTSADGSYKITGLRTGDYKVAAFTECDQQWYDHKPTWNQADIVNVTMPGEVSGIDFDFHNDPPNSFSLIYPPNKAFTPRTVHFDWETATDPNPGDQIKYDLYVSTSYHHFQDSATVDSNLVASEYMKTLNYGTYYWKVKAKDNHGGERWSNQMGYFMATGIPYSGDVNADGFIDAGDLVFYINYLFANGPAPTPLEIGDVDCDGEVNIADVVYLSNYLFSAGPAPCEL